MHTNVSEDCIGSEAEKFSFFLPDKLFYHPHTGEISLLSNPNLLKKGIDFWGPALWLYN